MILKLIVLTGMYLLLMSLLDIRHKSMPSIIPTGLILLLAIINHQFIIYGILAFIFAWLLYEFDWIRGVADLKAIVVIGLMLENINQFYMMMTLVVFIGMIYQLILLKILKLKYNEEVPFVPVFFFTFVTIALLEYVI